jgi:hypothetical protein
MSTAAFALGYLLLFLGVLALLLVLRRRARQDRAPFPENTRLLRAPGESLRRKVAELDDKIDNALLVGLVVPVGALCAGFLVARQFSGWTLVVVAALSVVVFALLIVRMAKRVIALVERWRNTSLGYFGERIVAEHLEPLKAAGHRVFHDVPAGEPPHGSNVPPFNIDHVVVGPNGVFAIETKTRRKGRARVGFMAHEIIYDGRALSYPWGEDQHGLEQALNQAEWLATYLQKQMGTTIPVRPLLVFPGWMIIRKDSGAVNVLNPRELPAAIGRGRAGATTLEPAFIDLVSRQLEALCRDVEL